MPFVAIGVFLVIIGVSIGVGFSDVGVIDIQGRIDDKKQNATPDELTELNNIPVQRSLPKAPHGGLVPTEIQPTGSPPAPIETGTSTATSTDESASSTEAVVEESAEEEVAEEGAETAIEETEVPEATESEESSEPPAEEPAV